MMLASICGVLRDRPGSDAFIPASLHAILSDDELEIAAGEGSGQ
jgi:hypothetical protein